MKRKGLIYVADDENGPMKLIVSAIEMLFPAYENRIDQFVDGEDLYVGIKENYINLDLVLTDNNMPGMDGINVIRKCVYSCPDVPFVLMSGFNVRKEALEAGARDFIEKPFKMEELERVLSRYLVKE